MENYLKVVYKLIKKAGYATQTDISELVDVGLPIVTKMLDRQDESKYLNGVVLVGPIQA